MRRIKDIHIGSLIETKLKEEDISEERVLNFLNCSAEDLEQMFKAKSIDTDILLRWSKLLKYDFFRLYSQHLIFYAPPATINYKDESKKTDLPEFRKNVYTVEIINFIVGLVQRKEKTVQEIMAEYNIPRTTLYKWLRKYKQS